MQRYEKNLNISKALEIAIIHYLDLITAKS